MSESTELNQVKQPPEAPEMPRYLHFHAFQLLMIVILMLVPVLSLFGVLGETTGQVTSEDADSLLTVAYPARAHYETRSQVRVETLNTSDSPLNNVTIQFDRAYFDQFSALSFNPTLSQITEAAYIVELGDIPAGASRMVTLDLVAKHQGNQRGLISLSSDNREISRVMLDTFVFP